MMPKTDVAECGFSIKEKDGEQWIFDELRGYYVRLTPEEWVRQNVVKYLVNEKGYPKMRIVNEASLEYNGKKFRCDTVVYDSQLKPRFVAEYKAPDVKLTQKTVDQVFTYNRVLKVDCLLMSNGVSFICYRKNVDESYDLVKDIPQCFFN